MTIHVYSVMRNEAPILPYFLRHYAFADQIYVWEDSSEDGTREMLLQNPKVILLEPLQTGLDDMTFARQFSTVYRKVSRGEADWCFMVDADEFIWSRDLMGELAGHAQRGEEVIFPEGWQMVSQAFPSNGGQIYEEIRRGTMDGRQTKPCIINPSVDIEYQPGRHHAAFQAKEVRTQRIKCLHFRWLGRNYIQSRNARNNDRLSQVNIRMSYGGHNRPGYSGQYDMPWYEKQLKNAVEVC